MCVHKGAPTSLAPNSGGGKLAAPQRPLVALQPPPTPAPTSLTSRSLVNSARICTLCHGSRPALRVRERAAFYNPRYHSTAASSW